MRVLVVADSKLEREALARILQAAAHRVELVSEAKAAVAAFTREAAQVLLSVGSSTMAIDLLRKIRAVQGTDYPYFVALLEKATASEIATLYAAGVDDFMRKPLLQEEFIGRIDAPRRIRTYATALLASSARDWSSAVDVRGTHAFRETASIVASDLAEIVGESLAVVEGAPKDPRSPALRCASIPMSMATDGLELRVSVIADRTALCAIGKVVMGEDLDEGAQRDLLRELANTAGGAIKRAYATDGVTLTTGLPVDGAAPVPDDATRWWIARAKEAGATIGLACELRERKNERVPAAHLREGMVITADLRNESGALLVAAGTRLTATSAGRVGRALGDRFLVQVLSAA